MSKGFWKSGINRAKSNKERLEDKLNTNIKTLETVDMGSNCDINILFADRNLEVDGRTTFTYDEMMSFIPYIKKHGWRIPDADEMHTFFMNSLYTINTRKFEIRDVVKLQEYNYEPFFEIKSKDTGNFLHFPLHKQYKGGYDYLLEHYWLLRKGMWSNNKYGCITLGPERLTHFAINSGYKDSVTKIQIRLIKDKKNG